MYKAIMGKYHKWCFTIIQKEYDCTTEYWEKLIDAETAGVIFVVAEKEKAPETGTMHIQGYVHFKYQKTMQAVKKWLQCPFVHLEQAGGSDRQNDTYCAKEQGQYGPVYRHGDPDCSTEKKKSLDSISDMIATPGVTLATIIDTVGMGQFARASNAIPRAMEEMRRPKGLGRPKLMIFTDIKVLEELFANPDHTDKTFEPRIDHKTKDFYFDHYLHQPYIVISCREQELAESSLDRIMSAYPRSYNTKGGTIQSVKPDFVYWHFLGGLSKKFETTLKEKYGATCTRPAANPYQNML